MLIPVESKQIAFCSYDEKEERLHLWYHTGDVTTFTSIDRAEYQTVLESSNRYDALMRIARKYEPAVIVDGTPADADIPVVWNNL